MKKDRYEIKFLTFGQLANKISIFLKNGIADGKQIGGINGLNNIVETYLQVYCVKKLESGLYIHYEKINQI